jgi:hypothetical protein
MRKGKGRGFRGHVGEVSHNPVSQTEELAAMMAVPCLCCYADSFQPASGSCWAFVQSWTAHWRTTQFRPADALFIWTRTGTLWCRRPRQVLGYRSWVSFCFKVSLSSPRSGCVCQSSFRSRYSDDLSLPVGGLRRSIEYNIPVSHATLRPGQARSD